MRRFKAEMWEVLAENGTEYTAIGYETRGCLGVPVADVVNGEYISCTVYEIVHEMLNDTFNVFISLKDPNVVELELLENAGWKWDGCFVHKV